MDVYEDAYFMVLCQYCEKKIPAISLDDHEDMCDGFINYISRGEHLVNPEPDESEDNVDELMELCKSCGDDYPVICMEEHKMVCEPFLAEMNLINFDDESTADDKSALKENEKSCERFVTCEFCDVEINFNAYGEHKDFCGSKTEKCVHCQKYIMLKEQEAHSLVHLSPEELHKRKENVSQDVKLNSGDQSVNKFLLSSQQEKSSDIQVTKKEAKKEIRKENELQKTSIPKSEESKKSGNMFTTDFEAGSSMTFENANPTRKTEKYPPIECEYGDDSTDDVKHISDDDCEETLEEFWTRARERLKRRRMLNAQ